MQLIYVIVLFALEVIALEVIAYYCNNSLNDIVASFAYMKQLAVTQVTGKFWGLSP